jgi:hypothetical protein
MKVAVCIGRGLPRSADAAKREPIDTLGRRRLRAFAHADEKCVRGDWAKSRSRLSRRALEGVKPMGASGGRHAQHVPCCEGLSQGSKPGNRGPSCRLVASAAVVAMGETVGGSDRARKRSATLREEKAPKGSIP